MVVTYAAIRAIERIAKNSPQRLKIELGATVKKLIKDFLDGGFATSADPGKENYSKANLCSGKSNAHSSLKSATDFFPNLI